MDAYIGEIKMFGGNFPPRNWMLCDGQLMNISSNTALYSILGTRFGGNGTTTFGLPNLVSKSPMGVGDGPGLTPRVLGETGGTNTYTLTKVPAHSHSLSGAAATNNVSSPLGAYEGGFPGFRDAPGKNRFVTLSDTKKITGKMDAATLSPGPGSANPAPVSNVQPYLNINFIICVAGVFPPRNQ
jgi:microcystin-dependent protein